MTRPVRRIVATHASARQARPAFERIEVRRAPDPTPQTPVAGPGVHPGDRAAPKPSSRGNTARPAEAAPAPSSSPPGRLARSAGGGGNLAPASASRGVDGSVTVDRADWRKISRLIEWAAREKGLTP
jgi:hypothetical protein